MAEYLETCKINETVITKRKNKIVQRTINRNTKTVRLNQSIKDEASTSINMMLQGTKSNAV